jgi:GNAT superfamily N-acetyltransferase
VEGYAGLYPDDDKRSLIEFYILPHLRAVALPIFREALATTRATHIEAQTNLPLMLLMLYDCATNITREAILFHDGLTTHLACPGGVLRRATPADTSLIFPHQHEPVGEWLIEVEGMIVATGGFYTHYNPPYADIFMEVAASARRQGYGSYLVQELKRLCYEAGKLPAARCHPSNIASRRTLQKAGLLPCANLLAGEVVHND